MTKYTRDEKPGLNVFSLLVLVFLAASISYLIYYVAIIRPGNLKNYENRLRADFHIHPNTKLIELADTKSGDNKTMSHPDSYFIQAVFKFSQDELEKYVKSLDDSEIWKSQLFSRHRNNNFYISDNAHRWKTLPEAPYENLPFLFGSRFVNWSRVEKPSEKSNKYFCYALEPVGPQGRVLGTAKRLKDYNCLISACTDFPIAKNTYSGPIYPAGIVMGVLDYKKRQLHISISPQDANWACKPRAAKDYLAVK